MGITLRGILKGNAAQTVLRHPHPYNPSGIALLDAAGERGLAMIVITAEPFERGFGVTVGNSLRRVLLSSLQGSAVTQIKIRGAQHEFSTIPGVQEDVTDIVLNVKSLVVKNHSESTKVITIEKSTSCVLPDT